MSNDNRTYSDRAVKHMWNKAKRIVSNHELARLIRTCYINKEEGTDEMVLGSEVYGAYWWPIVRDAVLNRDAYTCQMCGCKEQLEVHHIMHRQHGGSDHPYNLITLCTSCHDRVHGRIEVKIAKNQTKLDFWNEKEVSHV